MSSLSPGGPVLMATRQLKSEAFGLIDRKLTGSKRADAIAFVRERTRKQRDLENLIARLSSLPDAQRDEHPNARVSNAKVAEMRAKHAAGTPLRSLAAEYGLSYSQTQRICNGTSRTRVTSDDQ